ncbi:MAG: cobalt-precorrin-6A reductase [Alphaproteobacteria bacterium]
MPTKRILLLGGTTEASLLARRLAARGNEWDVVISFAGRTAAPDVLPGRRRVGGFGGAEGLARYLRDESIGALIDATHPFAARMPWNAAAACSAAGVPRVRLERAPWRQEPGDVWHIVPDLAAASDSLGRAERIFLTIGRQELAPFARHEDKWFLVRSIEPPVPLPLRRAEVLLARGPFVVEDEVRLLAEHRIDTLVSKNSGGTATAAKLAAARRLGLPIVMVERSPKPAGSRAETVEAALAWLEGLTPSAV